VEQIVTSLHRLHPSAAQEKRKKPRQAEELFVALAVALHPNGKRMNKEKETRDLLAVVVDFCWQWIPLVVPVNRLILEEDQLKTIPARLKFRRPERLSVEAQAVIIVKAG
jgi:hypothetical protein